MRSPTRQPADLRAYRTTLERLENDSGIFLFVSLNPRAFPPLLPE